jgi:hypothetical protein
MHAWSDFPWKSSCNITIHRLKISTILIRCSFMLSI